MHDSDRIATDLWARETRRGFIVRVPDSLRFPRIFPTSPLALRSKVHEAFSRTACHSSSETLKRFSRELPHVEAEAVTLYPGLYDELSPYLGKAALAGGDGFPKIRREFGAYSRMVKSAEAVANLNQDDFVELLLEIHRRLGPGANAFRSGPVRTLPDSAGGRVVYPHHGKCLALLRDLHAFTHAHVVRYPALCAVVTYVGINHAHPFADGNGRTARTVYNLVMAASGSRHFLPIYLFNRLAGGSLIIKVRRAMYGGDWDPLLAFFADASRLSDWLQTQDRELGTLPSPIN
jgi:hypothetical protein